MGVGCGEVGDGGRKQGCDNGQVARGQVVCNGTSGRQDCVRMCSQAEQRGRGEVHANGRLEG